jgi:hypothetical protein
MDPLFVRLLIAIGMVLLGAIALYGLYLDFTDARKNKKLSLWLLIGVIFEVLNGVYLIAIMFFLIGILIIIVTIIDFFHKYY